MGHNYMGHSYLGHNYMGRNKASGRASELAAEVEELKAQLLAHSAASGRATELERKLEREMLRAGVDELWRP